MRVEFLIWCGQPRKPRVAISDIVAGCSAGAGGVRNPCGPYRRYEYPKVRLIEVLITCVGTSIGAFVGGLYAREGDIISSAGRVKQFSGRMGNIWRMLSDVTYPIVAYTTVLHPI